MLLPYAHPHREPEQRQSQPTASHIAGQRPYCGKRSSNQSQHDLIIVDTSPETGLQICTRVRESGGVAPILVLAEKSDRATKAELLNAGADDCLAKSFATEELLARIRALLRRPAL